MSCRTIKAEPDNKTFLDTYAWIMFVKGRYKEAKEYIDKVIGQDSLEGEQPNTDVTAGVIEHAGDIYYKYGETDKALAFWKKALDMGEGTTDALPKKVKLKKYVENENNE